MIDTQHRRRRCVDSFQQNCFVVTYVSFLDSHCPGLFSKLEASFQFIAAPPAFFFIARDAFAPPGADVWHIQQVNLKTILPIESRFANGTKIKRVAAEGATCSAKPLHFPTFVEPARRRLEADNLPLRTFVVQNVPRCKLAQGEEPRTCDEFAIVSRYPGANGQRRKVVAG